MAKRHRHVVRHTETAHHVCCGVYKVAAACRCGMWRWELRRVRQGERSDVVVFRGPWKPEPELPAECELDTAAELTAAYQRRKK